MVKTTRLLAAALAAVIAAGTAAVAVPAATSLSAAERATLLSMREEEKLAHDVYVAFAARWGDRVFSNIAASETRHERAVETALAAYGLADPTNGYAVGSFPSIQFQALYDRLVARGAVSRQAALAVGVEIETLDIADLRRAIAETDEAMLDRIYGNLLAASTSHLAAFERVLANPTAAGGLGGPGWGRGPGR